MSLRPNHWSYSAETYPAFFAMGVMERPKWIDFARSTADPDEFWRSCSRGDWLFLMLDSLGKPPKGRLRKRVAICVIDCVRPAIALVGPHALGCEAVLAGLERWAIQGPFSWVVRPYHVLDAAEPLIPFAQARTAESLAISSVVRAAQIVYPGVNLAYGHAASALGSAAAAAGSAKAALLATFAETVRRYFPRLPALK